MVLFLNYLPLLLVVLFLFIAYKVNVKHKGNTKLQLRYTAFTVLGFLAAYTVLTALNITYFPKGTPASLDNPVIEAPAEEVVIQDRLLNTKKAPEKSKEDFDNMVDWRKAKADRDAARAERENKAAVEK